MAHRQPSPRPDQRGAPRIHQTGERRVRDLGQMADEETCQQKSKAPDKSTLSKRAPKEVLLAVLEAHELLAGPTCDAFIEQSSSLWRHCCIVAPFAHPP